MIINIGQLTQGITSTYVENTDKFSQIIHFVQDHLHIRGEYWTDLWKNVTKTGSPPHTWRIPFSITDPRYLLRITSTYVENTLACFCIEVLDWDHLHIRGEYILHVRDTPKKYRITSTYVENTWLKSDRVSLDRDHLHIRGEYQYTINAKLHFPGSPPHTWRIPLSKTIPGDLVRITSTYVENTN